MASRGVSILLPAIVALALASISIANVPRLITIQGRLTDDLGQPVVDGTYAIEFRIFDVSAGGIALWSTGDFVDVYVEDGIFNHLLGSNTLLPYSLGDSDSLWVEMEVKGSTALAPRIRLTSGMWSYRSAYADTADYARSGAGGGGGWWDDGSTVRLTDIADKVGIGGDSPDLKVTITDHGAQSGLEIDSPIPTIRLREEGAWKWDLLHYGPTDKLILQSSFDPTPVLTIDSDGDLGLFNEDPYLQLSMKSTGQNGIEIDNSMPTIRFMENGVFKWDLLHYGPTDKLVLQSSFDPTPVLTIDSDGDLGLFNDDPYLQLSMKSSHQNGIEIDNPMPTIRFMESGIAKWDLLHHGSSDQLLLVSNTTGKEMLSVDAADHLGLGTDHPLVATHVQGTNIDLSAAALHADKLIVEDPDAVLGLYSTAGGASGSAIALGEITSGALVDKWGIVRETTAGGSGLRFTFGTAADQFVNPMIFYLDDKGAVGIGTDDPNYTLDVRGTIGNNTTLYHSDRRWKRNIAPIPDALEKVTKLRGVSFEWRTDEFGDMRFPEGTHFGVVAQEIEQVLPELVHEGSDGFKSVEYANLTAVLIEAVKELKAENDELKQRMAELERRQGR